jgi:hypothetical protein
VNDNIKVHKEQEANYWVIVLDCGCEVSVDCDHLTYPNGDKRDSASGGRIYKVCETHKPDSTSCTCGHDKFYHRSPVSVIDGAGKLVDIFNGECLMYECCCEIFKEEVA